MTTGPHDAFGARRSAFEDSYFHKKDAELVEKLQQVFQAKRDREELQKLTNITSEEVLDRLMAVEAKGEMLTAFQLLPLVEIAWADGACDKAEADAVVAAAIKRGVAADSEALKRVKEWLARGPDPEARKAWYMYAQELRKTLSPAELKTFREDLVEQAQQIAALSGGLFDSFFKVSKDEKKVLKKMKEALGETG